MWLFCAPLTNKKESSIKLELFVPVSKVPFIISRTKKANRHGLKKSQQEGIIEVGIQTNQDTICGPFRKKNRSSFQIYCASLQPTIWQVIVHTWNIYLASYSIWAGEAILQIIKNITTSITAMVFPPFWDYANCRRRISLFCFLKVTHN